MATRTPMPRAQLLDNAVEILRRDDVLTLDSLARAAGLTKPGVLHHVGSKEGLLLAVVDHVVDTWEEHLRQDPAAQTGEPDATDRLRAYVDFAFTGNFDGSDLALFADVKLRQRLREQWAQRLEPWLGPTGQERNAHHISVRLLADGAWFNQALGLAEMTTAEKAEVRALAHRMLDDG